MTEETSNDKQRGDQPIRVHPEGPQPGSEEHQNLVEEAERKAQENIERTGDE